MFAASQDFAACFRGKAGLRSDVRQRTDTCEWCRLRCPTMIEPLLLTTTLVSTFCDRQGLTAASGFFFERDQRLYLVTSRHVLIDKPSGHFPNRIELTLHTDAGNLTHATALSVPLYMDGQSLWHQGRDAGGEIDVALIELDRAALPESVLIRSFTPAHLQHSLQEVEVGTSLLVVGFPLGFHDTLHHLPVVMRDRSGDA
jgi:hypothetical protein